MTDKKDNNTKWTAQVLSKLVFTIKYKRQLLDYASVWLWFRDIVSL